MYYSWKCSKCGFCETVSDGAKKNFCPQCGAAIDIIEEQKDETPLNDFAKLKEKAHNTLRSTFDFEKIEEFSFSGFIRQVFKKHPWDEIEEYMSCGIPSKRPQLSEINPDWPTPWLFFRVMLVTIFGVLFCYWQADFFGHEIIILPLLIFGIIGIPFATLILFWEVNIPKNISILLLTKTMLISGFVSIALTFFMHKLIVSPSNAIWAGPMEEVAKGLTMLFFLKNKRYCYKLNGLLIGAAVGTGFAFIETGKYTLVFGDETMQLRAFLSPFCHIPWSAIVGFALWRTCRDKAVNLSNLFNRKFMPLFGFSVLAHMFWNSSLLEGELVIKTAVVAVTEYTIIIYMLQEGINEIRKMKAEYDPVPEN